MPVAVLGACRRCLRALLGGGRGAGARACGSTARPRSWSSPPSMAIAEWLTRASLHRLPVERLRLRADAGAGDDAVGVAGRHLGRDARRVHRFRRARRLLADAAGTAAAAIDRRGGAGARRGARRLRRRPPGGGDGRDRCRASRLRIVQPAIPQDQRWQVASAEAIMARSTSPSAAWRRTRPRRRRSRMLIWPESAFPVLPDRAAGRARRDRRPAARRHDADHRRARGAIRRRSRRRRGVQQRLRHRRRRRDPVRLRQGPPGAVRRVPAVPVIVRRPRHPPDGRAFPAASPPGPRLATLHRRRASRRSRR